IKSMVEFFPAQAYNPGVVQVAAPALQAQSKRNIARVKALVDFIDRKPNDETATTEAHHYLRREALRTLALAGIPAVEFDIKAGKIEGLAVLGLLHGLAPAGKGASKTPSTPLEWIILTERLEAAIGVCQLQFDSKVDPQSLYQHELGVYL